MMPILFLLIESIILGVSLCLLMRLVIIDFQVRLLPNKYVFPFAGLGLIFHATNQFSLMPLPSLLIAGAFGYGLLWLIKFFGDRYYGQESLGLGDVKLMGAAGLWLGLEFLMLALTIGASFSVVHGLIYALITGKSLRRLEIPAGPGLIGGIIVMIIWMLIKTDWFNQAMIILS
jgi:leader peptidase (prepilin peptidase)/N-methyltransferase